MKYSALGRGRGGGSGKFHRYRINFGVYFQFRFKTETRMELKCQNVFQQIKRREYGLKQGPRSKIEILKTLILDVSIAFQSKFTRHEIQLSIKRFDISLDLHVVSLLGY